MIRRPLTILTLFVCAFLFTGRSAAQVILSQNFDSPVIPALPSGWTNYSTGPGWVTTTFSSISAGWGSATATTSPAHATQIAVVDDWNPTSAANLQDTMKSPVFSLAGAPLPWLNFESYYFRASGMENAYILGSNNGGTTWTVLDSVQPGGWSSTWTWQHINLASLGSGTNNRIAFTYSDAGGHYIGCALDSVEVVNLTNRAAAITSLDYNSKANGLSANGEPVSVTIENRGIPITSLSLYYQVNGGALVVQNFSSLSLSPYARLTLTFTTPIAGAAAGSNTIKAGILSVNGLSNTQPVDTVQTSSFTYASARKQRHGLVEKFGSSTGVPDYIFSRPYDSLCNTLHADSVGGNFNMVTYQMNWPSPGNDRSFNTDGNTRRSYYNVNAIPTHFVNGAQSALSWSNPFTTTNFIDFTNQANRSFADSSFVTITATYTIDTAAHKLNSIVQVTPHFTKTAGYHVYIALLDKYYQNTTNTNGQLNYYRVMRKMLPSASGYAVASWVDGVTQTFYDTAITYTNGNWMLGSSSYPVTNSNTFWYNPLLNSKLVAFVEEDATKSVMQSQVVNPSPICTPPSSVTIYGAASAAPDSFSVCQGSAITLTASIAGGSWSSSATGTATASGGVITGVAPGTATISYAFTNACGTATGTHVITVNPLPAAGTLSGSSGICAGSTTTLTPSIPGGMWSSSAPGIAPVAGGVVVGSAVGTAVISYTFTNSCGSSSATVAVVVSAAAPSTPSLTGSSVVCAGSTVTLTPSVTGGTWTTSASGIATVLSGVVSGVAVGTANVTYTVTNGCGSASTTQVVTVNPAPDAGTVTGPDSVCIGATIMLSGSASGGSWSTSLGHAIVSTSGVVAGTSAGVEMVSYTVTNSCGSDVATMIVKVVDCTLGTGAIRPGADIRIMPNPAYNTLLVSASQPLGQVIISNVLGQQVYQGIHNGQNAEIDMSALPSGTYLLRTSNSAVYRIQKH